MKKKILYLFAIFLISQLTVWAQAAQEPVPETAVAGHAREAETTNVGEKATSVSQGTAMSIVEKYVEQKADKIPHRSFWSERCNELHQLLLAASERVFSPKTHEFLAYVLGVVFDIPVLILLIFLSLTFILNIILVALFLLITTFYKSGRELYRKKLNEQLEQLLTDYLFYDVDEEETLQKLRKVNSPLGRNVLIDMLFNYQRNLSGEYRDRILNLYKRLDLQKVSEKRISSFYTHRRVRGIRELSNMYPSGARELILKYVRDKNDLVRSEAQIAYAYLDKEAAFDFLDDLKSPLSKWVQLNILNYVKLHEKEVPSFGAWLHSPNKDVQDFSVRMINYFQQNENEEQLIKMLDHPNAETRSYIYQAIRSLNLFEAKAEIKKRYEQEDYQNKIEILQVLEALGDKSDIDFLAVVVAGDDVRLKTEATRVLYRMGEAGKAFLKEYSEAEDMSLNKFVEHIKDKRN
ncbi:MAG: HEAT repeat domain-containing protein [Mangrovibacterium sp.]